MARRRKGGKRKKRKKEQKVADTINVRELIITQRVGFRAGQVFKDKKKETKKKACRSSREANNGADDSN